MAKKTNMKKTVWLYAVILFSSAFIVLLLTAYSQIKFNKNIEEYRSKISNEENEKINFMSNLKSAQEENEKLMKEIEKLKVENSKSKSSLKKTEENIANNKKIYDKRIYQLELMLKAEENYYKGNIVECIKILIKQIDRSYLTETVRKRYDQLLGEIKIPSAEQLYYRGYENYKNGNYRKAIEEFKFSIELTDQAYYSDDCFYFLGYTQYRLDNKKEAISTFKEMMKRYPESSYKRNVEMMLENLDT